MHTHSHGGDEEEEEGGDLVMVQKSKMHKESCGFKRASQRGCSNYGCSSELRRTQRLLAETRAPHVHAGPRARAVCCQEKEKKNQHSGRSCTRSDGSVDGRCVL